MFQNLSRRNTLIFFKNLIFQKIKYKKYFLYEIFDKLRDWDYYDKFKDIFCKILIFVDEELNPDLIPEFWMMS